MKLNISFSAFLFLVALGLFTSCQKEVENGFRVSGKIEGGSGELALQRHDGNSIMINSIQLDADGSFSIEVPNANKAAYLLQHNVNLYPFIYDGTDKDIVINALAENLNKGEYTVIGSEVSKMLQENYKKVIENNMTLKDFTLLTSTPDHPYLQSYLTNRFLTYGSTTESLHRKAFDNLKAADQNSKLLANYAMRMSRERANRLKAARKNDKKGGLELGQMAPDIALPNPDGDMMKLSDLKGKVVLVDFWASWCGPCRKYGNPKLVKLYKKYDKKKFAIMNVALERGTNNSRWISAIEQDGLVWPYQVVDIKRKFSPLYGASSIPRIYLIDKDGKLAAINPQGPELEKTIEKLMKT